MRHRHRPLGNFLVYALTLFLQQLLFAGPRRRRRKRQRELQSERGSARSEWKISDGSRGRVTPSSDERFVQKMREIAAESGGSVQVLEPSGRRTVPLSYVITPLDGGQRADLGFQSVASASVVIEAVTYEFHAWFHPRANAYDPTLRFSVFGPGREDYKRGEFVITPQERWTAGRPLNPLLVKYVLREWRGRPDVLAAIALAQKALPVPKKQTPAEVHG